jgi:hypothetical protein
VPRAPVDRPNRGNAEGSKRSVPGGRRTPPASPRRTRKPAQAGHRPPSELRLHRESSRVPELSAEEFDALVADIEKRGLLQPLEVTAEGIILDGKARLKAALTLSLPSVPLSIVAPADEVDYMIRAALTRRHLPAWRRVELALLLVDYEQWRDEAQARKRANLPGQPKVATFPLWDGKTRERLARIASVSGRTVQDAVTVIEEDPSLFEQVAAGDVPAKRAIRQVRQRRLRTRLGETPPLPEGVFQVIQADPPWASGNPDSDWAPENHYPTMSLEEIKAFPVPAADDAALYLWALGCQLPQALEVMAAWDFRYVGQIIWVKDSIGLGTWVRYRHEPLLIGIRGRMAAPPPALRPDSVIVAPRRKHSQSPTRPTS